MLDKCERMVVIPPIRSNEWTQIDDQKVVVDSMASSGRFMEKPGQELLQQQQQPLKCPRCDSSNTKFCYYNNYSLSQPRHFCKSCKRYWTRGGTLRNVPVGGGCRKNKRATVKPRQTTNSSPNSNIDTPSSPSTHSANSSNPLSQPCHIINPNLFYGLLPSNSCADVINHVSNFPGYNDLHPQMNNGYANGFGNSDNSTYNSIFGSCSSSTPADPVMASLLSSTLLQQNKFINGCGSNMTSFHGLGLATLEGNMQVGMMANSKEVMKGEGQHSRLEWNINGACQNQIEQMGFSDPNSLYNWNTGSTTIGAWSTDQPNNIGPSVTSLF